MTTDMERELRELFRDKAGEAPVSTLGTSGGAPQQVLRRGRRHQVGTVLGSVLVAAVLAVGSFAGLRSLIRGDADPFQTGTQYEIFQRTATIEAFTITSPSDWYLVNQWPLSMQIAVEGSAGSSGACVAGPGDANQECDDTGVETSSPIPVPYGLPMLQLTNVDLGLDANACRDGLQTDGAALYVALDAERAISGIADPSIPPFPPGGPGLPPEGDGPCGPGRYTRFTVNGEPFFAWIGLGSDVSEEDRETVETSYERMSAIPDWTPQPPDQVTPGYVIAGFTEAGHPWRLEARPGGDVTLSQVIASESSDFEFALGDQPVTWCCSPISYPGQHGSVLFGTVQTGASGVEFGPDDGSATVEGTIVPTPPSLGSGFDLFFIEGANGVGEVVAVGLGEGQAITPAPSAAPRRDEVELSGTYLGIDWLVRATGSFADGDACIRGTIAGENNGPLCHAEDPNPLTAAEPSADSWTTDHLNLFVTSVDPEVVELRFRSDDGSNIASDFHCTMGPTGWTNPDRRVCVLPLPPQGSGTIQFLDADGTVLFEHGMGWDPPRPRRRCPPSNRSTAGPTGPCIPGSEPPAPPRRTT